MMGRVAGYAMEQLDTFLGKLGHPIGLSAYRPPHAIGEEFRITREVLYFL